jgi:ribosomal protein L16 Arg81 hydroxylase
VTYELQAGDVLYLPEGWAHEAFAEGSHSLHATVRLFPLRLVDVVVSLASTQPELARAVPRRGLDDEALLTSRLLALLDSSDFRAQLGLAVAQYARDQFLPARALPEDGLQHVLVAPALTLETLLVRRASATCDVYVDGKDAVLAFPGGKCKAPAALESLLREIASGREFRPSDLPCLGPDAAADRLAMVRQLVNAGLLRTVACPSKESERSQGGNAP